MIANSRYRGLGASDGRRSRPAQALPNLGSMSITSHQKAALDARARSIVSAPPFIHPELSLFHPPGDADTFNRSSLPAPVYPPHGASAVIVLSFTVPASKMAVIQFLSIVHNGGNPPDFTGQVIWRVLKNGAAFQGLNNLTAQFGTFAAPKQVSLIAVAGDVITVTAEVPAAWADMPAGATTAASFDGFMYPQSEALSPRSAYGR
jgi:hypothetical protein